MTHCVTEEEGGKFHAAPYRPEQLTGIWQRSLVAMATLGAIYSLALFLCVQRKVVIAYPAPVVAHRFNLLPV